MAPKLSAPVGEKKRITKADPKKNEKFKPVQNKPADVELVQLMLVANGFRVNVNGKCDAVLIKNIREFQKKKLGYKTPDGIVDPNAKTWNAGLAKLNAMIAANAKLEVYEVFEGGKKKLVSKKEYEAGLKALKKEIVSKAAKMYNEAEGWANICHGFEGTRAAQDGLVAALTEFSVSTVNSKTNPPWDDISSARSTASDLKAMASAAPPDWRMVHKQDQKATKAYNKAVKSFKKFIAARIGTAGGIISGLELIQETSFAAVETYMTARLVVTKGMSPTQANIIAATSVQSLKTGAGQFGEYVAGNKVTWDGAAKKVFIDSFIAGLTATAGGKLGDALSKGLAGQLAKYVMPKLSGGIPTKVGEVFFKRFLESKIGQAMVVSALKETIGMMKPLIEKGSPPSLNDVKDAVAKTLLSGIMTQASVKALDAFTKNLSGLGESFLKTTMAPRIMESMRKDLVNLYGAKNFDELASKHSGEIYLKVATSLSDKSIEKAALSVISETDGTRNAAQLQKLANDALRRDADLRKKIEHVIRSEFAREAKKLPMPAN